MTDKASDKTQTIGDTLKKPRIGRLYALVIILGLPSILIGGDILWREAGFRMFATQIEGTVVDKSRVTARKGQEIYKLDYSIGGDKSRTAYVNAKSWSKYNTGDKVPVLVVGEGENNHARLAFEGTHHAVTGLIFFGLGVYIFLLVFMRLNFEKKKARNGEFVIQLTDARRRTHLLLWLTMMCFVLAQFF